MDDTVLALFEDFAARLARGERPDPAEHLRRAGPGAGELRGMIDRLLREAPPPAEPDAADLAAVDTVLGADPPLLRLRIERGMTVDALVGTLLASLGLDPARRPRLRRRYQQMEAGLLDPSRIDARVLAAVAGALGLRPGELPVAGPSGPPADVVFARVVPGSDGDVVEPAPPPRETGPPDEVDRLFGLGGPLP